MLKPGLYISEYDSTFESYTIKMNVKETEKSYIFELVDFKSRYDDPHFERLFKKSNKVVLRKDRGGHALRIWGDDYFTFYPYQAGIPYIFELLGGERMISLHLMEITDLESIKCVAKTLLYVDLKLDNKVGFIVHHPFFKTTVGTVVKNGIPEMIDLTTTEGLHKARLCMEDEIRNIDCYSQFLIIINTPYLPVFFQMTYKYLSLSDFSEFLGAIWTQVEFPNADPNVHTDEFVTFFKQADPTLLMETEDYEVWKALPNEITVYRGIAGNGKVKKLSWTLSEETARWFAGRWDSNGRVYRAKIRKEDVLAYFGDREENEIVLNPQKLIAIKRL